MQNIFKPIALKDRLIFDTYFNQFPQRISEFTFTNLFCWRLARNYEFIEIDGHLLISFPKDGRKYFFQPIGPHPEVIIQKITKIYQDQKFVRVEKSVAEKLGSNFKIEHDRDQDDYIYNIKDLQELHGKKYDGKRNLIKKLETYKPTIYKLDKSHIKHCIDFQKRWCDSRDCENDSQLYAEDLAVKEYFANFEVLGGFGTCIIINGQIEAFATGEHLNENTIVEHFEKGNIGFHGIYQYLLKAFVKNIPAGYALLNREQDVGYQGLRKAKLSYHPMEMVEKYNVS